MYLDDVTLGGSTILHNLRVIKEAEKLKKCMFNPQQQQVRDKYATTPPSVDQLSVPYQEFK